MWNEHDFVEHIRTKFEEQSQGNVITPPPSPQGNVNLPPHSPQNYLILSHEVALLKDQVHPTTQLQEISSF